jgi:AraC-like DNA-binding protein
MVDQVLVGLMMGGGDLDPIDEAIRRNALQRDAVELARETGNALSGRVGEHGVVLLCGRSASKNRKRQKAQSLAERAVTLAHERYRISLHFGLAEASEALPLSHAYQAALAAAESALVAGSRIVIAGHGQGRARRSFHRLREDLARAEERPAVLAARFERYLEAVAIHCGYRIEPALAHLEVGFERVAHGLLQAGVLGEKNFEVLYDALERATARARTIDELFAIYRRAVSDVAGAVRQPVPARRDHNLRRALAYIHDHYQERLRIAQVARVAGFNRSHFSKLFIKRENMSFEDYVCGLRLERAQQLLADTDLAVTRVAELSGFVSPQYLCRVFRRARGITPGEFRRNPRSPEPKAKKKPSKG